MRVVTRQTFMTLPQGTVYSKGKQWWFKEFCIKMDTIIDDEGKKYKLELYELPLGRWK